MIKTFLAITALLAALPNMATAANWQIAPDKSTLSFAGKQMGSTTKGVFNTFQGDITFEPTQLDKAHAKVVIDIASMETPSPVIRSYLLNPDWFDVRTYPQAMFTSHTFNQQGENTFTATGAMTINGQTQEDIEVTFTVAEEADGKQIIGQTTLQRRDYDIGKGQWNDTSVVADDVDVTFNVYLTPAE